MSFTIENGVITQYSGSETHLIIPDGVIRIDDNVFEGHTEIQTVTFPESLTEIGNEAFMGCSSLKSIELSDNVTSIGSRAFYQCHSLEKVRLSKNLTKIPDQCFMETAISSIDLHEGITVIDNGAFAGCHNLKCVTVPDSVEEINVLAFGFDSNWDTRSKRIEDFELRGSIHSAARKYAHKYELRFVPIGEETDLPEFEIKDGVLICYNGSSEHVNIPREVTEIGEYAFKANRTLRSVTIPNTVTKIGFHAFEDCENLKEVDIPGSVKEIVAYAFMRCSRLKKVTLHNGLLIIGTWAFGNCKSLTFISIPKTVIKIDDNALGYEESSYQDRYVHGIQHRYCYGLKIDQNGNEAVALYIARHRLTMILLRGV